MRHVQALEPALEEQAQARLISETKLEILWGVLDSMFDATCQCDGAGYIFAHTSSRMQHLLGGSPRDLLDFNLVQLAANLQEAQRLRTFFKQICLQKRGSAVTLNGHFVGQSTHIF